MPKESPPSDEISVSTVSRRKLLAMTTGAATAGLAGCSGGGDTGPDNNAGPTIGTDVRTESGKNVVDSKARDPRIDKVQWLSYQPKKMEMNPLSPSPTKVGPAWIAWREKALNYSFTSDGFQPYLLKELPKVDGCEVTFNYREDFTWWDGEPVNADDHITRWKLTEYFYGDGPEASDESIEKVDEFTVKKTLPRPFNPTIVAIQHEFTIGEYKTGFYGKYVDKFEKAKSDEEIQAVKKELIDLKVDLQTYVDEGLGNGMWKPTEWSTTEIISKPVTDHPYAKQTNLETLRMIAMSDSQKKKQSFSQDNLDWGRNVSSWRGKVKAPKGIKTLSQYRTLGGPKACMNWRNEHLARRGVRRAIAYITDFEKIAKVLKQGYGKPVETPGTIASGMTPAMEKKYLGEEFLGKLIDYGTSAKPKKAKQAMKNAGYTKNGDVWTHSNGKKTTGISYYAPDWGPWPMSAKTHSEMLNAFGIKNDFISPESGSWGKVAYESYDFDINQYPIGTNEPHPTRFYDLSRSSGYNGFGTYEDLVSDPNTPGGCSNKVTRPKIEGDTSPVYNHPFNPTPKFPAKVGAKEISGNGQRFRPFEWNRGMELAQTEEEVSKYAKKAAWYHNFQALHIEIFSDVYSMWGDTGDFIFAPNGEPELGMGNPEWLTKRGGIKGRPKQK
ncbi:ABC transporter substrate-binding protein [Haladaptatus caseinilyticus]|uniref:ABC transporter substrate-binding protein n=1 Tax=Haladaptatus caseinilyticus TaxID=2993314 RepID=UPI00224B193A|nr:ABC transporter substrate-binding protein [Haladaptatus caseinilyticus]